MTIPHPLAPLFDPLPPDLATHFDEVSRGGLSGLVEIEVNLSTVSEALAQTAVFRDFHPVVRSLAGCVLDDPGTSDHHVYLSRPPLGGAVLFLSHDGGTRVVYASLGEFRAAAHAAKQQSCALSDCHPPISPVAADQAGLSALAHGLLDQGDETDTLMAIIPSMDLLDIALLERLVADEDFFLGEAVAMAIERRPAIAPQDIVKRCEQHPHPQVSNAGRRARQALGRLR